MSKVSEDRDLLKRCVSEEGEYFNKEMRKNFDNDFSYINSFLKYRPKQEESGIRRKIRNLSTINILYSVYFSFKKVDKSFITKIEKIKNELSTRIDLFPAVLDFLENNEIVYDDLYFWHPGLKYSDVFSLILDLLPNIVLDFKKYFVQQLILMREPKLGILEVFKNRLNKNLGDFEVIKKDLLLFKIYQDCQLSTEYEEILSVGIKRKEIKNRNSIKRVHTGDYKQISKYYKVVTAYFWKENDDQEEVCDEVLKLLGGVDLVKDYSEDMELIFCPSLSYLDITINGKNIIVKMNVLNDLVTQNERSKIFWIENGIINENWEYL